MNEVKLCIIPVLLFFASCTVSHDFKWKQEEGYRWAEVSPGYWGTTGFQMLSSRDTKINFKNRLTNEQIAENRNLMNGSGVAAGDIDGDGLTDLYFAQLDGPNRLYKNLGGFAFEDITERAGVSHSGYLSTGVVFADVDGDTDLDLLVASMGKQNTLYMNDGNGKFRLKEDSGLGAANGSSTLALADIDGDSDLDLYITNYKEKSVKDLYNLMEITWDKTVMKEGDSYRLIPPFDEHFTLIPGNKAPDRRELGTQDELYINRGDGSFDKVTNQEERFLNQEGEELGLEQDWGLTAKFQDLNSDGHPDLYVCNDFWTPDRVWINRGDGTFKAIDKHAIRNFSFSSMAVDFSDINRDGSPDFFVTEMLSPAHQTRLRQAVTYSPFIMNTDKTADQPQYMRNTMYLNRGDGTFAEIAHYSGVAATGWSWATHFMDINLDGYEDLVVNTGNAHDVQDLDTQERLTQKMMRIGEAPKGYILEYPSLKLKNRAFRNNGDLTFTDKSSEWGFTSKDISHGLAVADLDSDGDLDMAVNRLNQEAAIYENITSEPRIAVRLTGRLANTQAIGAKVKLEGGPAPQQDEITAGGGYLSGSDPLVVFAANEDSLNHVITVTWPDGKKSRIDSVHANRIYDIEESKTVSETLDSQKSHIKNKAIFKDVSGRIDHKHYEAPYNDFYAQPLLPVRLSRLGPGISWIDFDSDGDDDLFITSGREGKPAAFENLGKGSFNALSLARLTQKATGDQTTILGWSEEQETKLIVGTANYERNDIHSPSALSFSFKNGIETDTIPGMVSSTGTLSVSDYDSDRDLDLFVAGRFVPSHYPENASSRLFKNENGRFVLDEQNSAGLKNLGLVTASVFSDFDGDGDSDLLISRAWGSLVLLQNNEGVFEDASEQYGLDKYSGWWNGIATGDFNNDGRPDIITTNLGLNSIYQAGFDHPLKIYYDDFDRDQDLDIIEAYYNNDIESYVPRQGLYELHNSISTITKNVRSHRQFAGSSLGEILGKRPEDIPSKSINTLEHMLFINEGNGFSAHPLPKETQFSAAFYAGVADFDNDGNEDVFLSQNLFSLSPLTPRLDAGRGLWLKGDGEGGLKPLSGSETGIKIYGEQRGAALSDFNRDGKVDLAVSQNCAETKLYISRIEKPGIRIRLNGPDSNINGIGSGIRLIYEGGSKGPIREIQAGSGYWSQNSTTQVMGRSGRVDKIEVRWFDGTIQTVDFTTGKKMYNISYSVKDRKKSN